MHNLQVPVSQHRIVDGDHLISVDRIPLLLTILRSTCRLHPHSLDHHSKMGRRRQQQHMAWHRSTSRRRTSLHHHSLVPQVLQVRRLFQRAGSRISITTRGTTTIFTYPRNRHNGNFPKDPHRSIYRSPCLPWEDSQVPSAQYSSSHWHLQDFPCSKWQTTTATACSP